MLNSRLSYLPPFLLLPVAFLDVPTLSQSAWLAHPVAVRNAGTFTRHAQTVIDCHLALLALPFEPPLFCIAHIIVPLPVETRQHTPGTANDPARFLPSGSCRTFCIVAASVVACRCNRQSAFRNLNT
jgi:hypothetical protein